MVSEKKDPKEATCSGSKNELTESAHYLYHCKTFVLPEISKRIINEQNSIKITVVISTKSDIVVKCLHYSGEILPV